MYRKCSCSNSRCTLLFPFLHSRVQIEYEYWLLSPFFSPFIQYGETCRLMDSTWSRFELSGKREYRMISIYLRSHSILIGWWWCHSSYPPPLIRQSILACVLACATCNASCTLSPSAFGESCPRWDCASATLYTLAGSSQFWRATRGDSQARYETLWLVHYGPLKKWDLNEARHEHQGYTRGSKVRRVFPSTFSLSHCLGFPQWECTAGITLLASTVFFASCMANR